MSRKYYWEIIFYETLMFLHLLGARHSLPFWYALSFWGYFYSNSVGRQRQYLAPKQRKAFLLPNIHYYSGSVRSWGFGICYAIHSVSSIMWPSSSHRYMGTRSWKTGGGRGGRGSKLILWSLLLLAALINCPSTPTQKSHIFNHYP